jgi:mono/diheme cytochrome c family protein
MRRLAFALALLLLPASAWADGRASYATECSACHLAYPPQLMPARSWRKLLAHLSSHFGEDASLSDKKTASILAYLEANAADRPGSPRFAMRGLSSQQTPERITDMPFWRRIHSGLLVRGIGSGPGIRAAANCLRCHGGSGEDD